MKSEIVRDIMLGLGWKLEKIYTIRYIVLDSFDFWVISYIPEDIR